MTRILAIASSIGNSSFAATAREKASPCSVYWSQTGTLDPPAAADEIGAGVDERSRSAGRSGR